MHDMSEEFLAPVLGKGVIAATNGNVWKKLHSAMSPAFSWGHVRSLVPVLVQEVTHLRARLDQLAESGEVFSMEDVVSRLIFDVIGRVLFNERLDAQGEGGSQILSDLKEMVKLAEAGLSMNPIVKLKAKLRKRTVLGRLHPVLTARVQERYDRLMMEGKVPSRKANEAESVLDLMLREQLQHDQEKEGGKKEAGVPPEMMESLLNNLKGLLVGGHGTTTDTLCFAYLFLSNNPGIMEKMRKEHRSVFGTAKFEDIARVLDGQPGKLGELPYTTAVINETLRLFPVGFGVRVAPDAMTLQHDGTIYPLTHPDHGGKGKMVVIPMGHYVHYSPIYFEDPAKFKPERWLEGDGVPRKCFRTFGRGPRACLGQTLAMDEMRVVLLATVGQWEFEYVRAEEKVEGVGDAKLDNVRKPQWTGLDEEYGDVVWQELGIEAKPRGGVPMKVRRACSP